ncbi:1-acyl-sn-glycerol-3-phosphate acyltransferase [Nocardia puris]|uniref:Acyltransferase-like protein n=1 Tax=Nocardia puris TaxID=208602 RepID=A0A366DN02_9NOCA|nr:1-acyl-sn-glycerol-3-phosphate acyltransferase [Nocardia puris]MBF6213492.1 1-acyl-sn-glycerol-3-phosphate acyltransferase [Nocardia puris]MBF6365578.1 1-acyl-sn-glycerol-3-phosphate acyltransferase [Nocardia puris]MBF6460044.1 1-acyl-sn-glycerol-3-phosphate acyltransferase [Nocardia puris]RBO91470.1 acyltransferase-like protein [Nocardia puris]
MQPPEVVLENCDTVYDFYRNHRQNRLKALAAYALLGRRYRPRISYAEQAKQKVKALIRSGTPTIFAINHLSQNDPYTVAAAAWRSPLRPIIGKVRVLAKDELFVEPEQRRKVDMMGGIPVFRGKDHGIRAVNAAGQRMMDVCAERLAGGDHLAIFPEGTCNDVDPTQVQAIGSGIGHIAFRTMKLDVQPALVCLGLSYGPRADPAIEPTKEEAVSASFYFRPPITDLPAKPAEIARLVRTDLQLALDGAVAAY